jgi:hypothetical protein
MGLESRGGKADGIVDDLIDGGVVDDDQEPRER